MLHGKFSKAILLIILGFLMSPINAQEVQWNGWLNVDYGVGEDRYGTASGGDRMAISQVALNPSITYENFKFVGVFASEVYTDNDNSPTRLDIKDAFLVWSKIAGSMVSLNIGAQPLLFGLKPNGYPGDRSLNASVEFGGAGVMAVSQQAGPSVKVSAAVTEFATVTAALFDFNASNTAGDNGSALYKNFFAQVYLSKLLIEGLYGMAGYEQRYMGGDIDAGKPIIDAGIGFKNNKFDASAEFISLDKSFSGTANNETYLVFEAGVSPMENVHVYGDWGKAQEADAQTLRFGSSYKFSKFVVFQGEFSQDDFAGTTISSVDFRICFKY